MVAGPSPLVSICRRCGVVAPKEGSTCEVCKLSLSEARAWAPPLPPDQCWVAVRCGFTCNSCRFLAPLESVDADGAVECAHCGLRQRFDVDLWRAGLAFAHAVGDLSGPEPEGRNPHPTLWVGSENPHAETGLLRTFEHATFGALAIDAAPGHPVCGRCLEPVNVSLLRPGAVETLCARCGDRASHSIADTALALCPGLGGAVSGEHRSDRPQARMSATAAGVLALSCPACGAPLEIKGTGTIHTCGYCRATCIVPHKSVARALRQTPEPTVFWLLFRGLSPERRELLAPPSAGMDATVSKAVKLLKFGRVKAVGDKPGVYEAPERGGLNVAQLLLTVALGTIALLIGLALTRLGAVLDLK